VSTITIVDYKLNNLRSLENTLRRLGNEVLVTSDPDDVRKATKLILPGVGAFGDGMRNLNQFGLSEPFINKVKSGTPTLGICLGMHLLFSESEEFGHHEGLNLIEGRIVKLPSHLRVPHMGWNQLHAKRTNGLTRGIEEGSFVYFVHSYYAEPRSEEIVLSTTDYEMEFPAVVHSANIWATQFHPEKSQNVGERILYNFSRI
jgi:glutamine amidotransferase